MGRRAWTVAGLTVGNLTPDLASTHSLLMNSCLGGATAPPFPEQSTRESEKGLTEIEIEESGQIDL